MKRFPALIVFALCALVSCGSGGNDYSATSLSGTIVDLPEADKVYILKFVGEEPDNVLAEVRIQSNSDREAWFELTLPDKLPDSGLYPLSFYSDFNSLPSYAVISNADILVTQARFYVCDQNGNVVGGLNYGVTELSYNFLRNVDSTLYYSNGHCRITGEEKGVKHTRNFGMNIREGWNWIFGVERTDLDPVTSDSTYSRHSTTTTTPGGLKFSFVGLAVS